jgi:hypothetical protein
VTPSVARATRALCGTILISTALPSLVACGKDSTDDEPTLTIDELKDPVTCKKCHVDHYNEWAGSMHAYASVDPVFRAMNARGQKETNKELGPFCVKCHAPMAVQEKATTDGTNMADVKDKFQGITCYFCHQVTDVKGTHDNPLILANDATMRGGYDNPTKNTAHHGTYSSLHDSSDPESAKLCGSCHDISVPAHFSGAPKDVDLERTFAEWQGSVFATGKTPFACGNCHFERIEGVPIANYPGVGTREVRHGHRFSGVDVALTDFPDRDAQQKAVLNQLSTSLRVQVCAPIPGLSGDVTVQVENVAVGHSVPSGASQDRRLWAEVHVFDNKAGQPDHETLSSGVVPAGTAVTDLVQTDPNLVLFRDQAFDKDGNPAHMFWQIASETTGTIHYAETNDPTDSRYHTVGDVQTSHYRPPVGTTHVTVTLHMQPIGREVLDDLVNSGDLDASIREAMPTFDLLPNTGVPVTVDWTYQAAQGTPGGNQNYCVETALPGR